MDLAAERGAWRREGQSVDAVVRDRMEAAFGGGLASRPVMPVVELAEARVEDDPRTLDAAIVETCRRLRVRDLAIGDLLVWLDARREWRGLGYLSFAHCVERRVLGGEPEYSAPQVCDQTCLGFAELPFGPGASI